MKYDDVLWPGGITPQQWQSKRDKPWEAIIGMAIIAMLVLAMIYMREIAGWVSRLLEALG